MLLTCRTCFHLFLYFLLTMLIVLHTNTLVCENLLGSKPDPDSDPDSGLVLCLPLRTDTSDVFRCETP